MRPLKEFAQSGAQLTLTTNQMFRQFWSAAIQIKSLLWFLVAVLSVNLQDGSRTNRGIFLGGLRLKTGGLKPFKKALVPPILCTLPACSPFCLPASSAVFCSVPRSRRVCAATDRVTETSIIAEAFVWTCAKYQEYIKIDAYLNLLHI